MNSQSLVTIPESSATPPAEVPPPPAIKQSSRQTRHLAQAVQLEESGTSPMVRFTMLVASIATCAFIIWSTFTNIDEVAIAEGSIFPSGLIQQIQHLEGGIVDEVMVKEGQLVEVGQPLVRLNPAQAIADLEQSRAREATLLMKAERLRAFVEGRQPDFSVIGQGYERLIDDNNSIFETALRSRDTSRAIILAQIEQKRSDIRVLDSQVKGLKEQANALREELRMREELVAKGLVTRIVYLDNKRELARIESEVNRVTGQMTSARESLNEIENRLIDHQSTLHKTSMDELGVAVNELAQVQESIGRLEDRVNRLVITAPTRGYLKGFVIHNTGAVIQPGGLVAEIVPADTELKAEIKVTPRDVGHLKVGQSVRVKISTYDFARYGLLMGTLASVSSGSFLNDKGEPYFRAIVVLDKNYVGNDPTRFTIAPGMTVQAEVITGNKTLLQYLLKPVFTQLQQSFHER